ncbi:Glutathione S-transferase [Acromyrmex echinatior]|uniref:glutathione transferase n=2 Tax=Acromyrmex TaxID=64782 RepID=F4W5B6_ACREC|nr:Glutathione S-transferase [Acromyrmex echinatior]
MSVSMQIDSGMLTNPDTSLCRVCLTVDHNNQCIFRRNWDDPESPSGLSEKLQLCCGVEVLEDDGLPTSICLECVMKVNVAYELRKQCQKADVELRKLYGKSLKTNIASIPTKDQCCQTDQSFILDAINLSDNIELNADNEVNIEKSIMQSNVMRQEQIPDAFDQIKHDVSVDNEVDLDSSKYKQVEHDKIANRTRNENSYRTRRIMFKRVTSIENLRNYKERQRRYIKKSVNVKRDSSDSEYQTKARNVHGRMDRASEVELQYKCQKCDRFYSSKKSLDRHISTHNDKEFKCDSCDKQFFCLDKLHKHINLHRVKEKPKPVLCKICNKSFRKIDTMVRHLNTHKKAYPKDVFSILKEIRDKRRLENNPESFETSLTLDENEQVTHDGQFRSANNGNTRELRKRNNTKVELRDSDLVNSDSSDDKTESFDDASLFNCKHCSKSYRTERSLQRHLLIHDEKKYVCNVCNMKFFRQDRLKSHMDRYGHDETKMCSEPQKPPDDKSAIKLINTWIREELDSDNEGKGFPCRICGKSYDTKKSLLKHQMNAHGGQNEYCTSCGTVCNCAYKDQEKGNEKSKPYTCEECNKSFEKEIKLHKHLRIHERAKEQQDANFKRFLCHICSKTFRQNTGLMFHMRTHTGYKPHVCKYCGRGFTSNSNCINHERTHTGDRPFVCQYCSAAFAKSCTLKAHITTHTGEANYHCKTCGKSFRRLKYLKEHRFTHTGEKPYACKICGTAYSHSGSLFVHEKKCKAQFSNYQSGVVQNAQQQQQVSYSQSPQTTGGISVASTSSVVAPIITTLPQAHLNVINSTLNVQANKDYVDNVQRMNAHAATNATTVVSSGLHPNVDISEMSSAVRNFSIIGQINMPSYKLIYFPITALAEPIRFLFNYAGIEFEDERFDRNDWPKLKPTMPFGKVPVLEVDGKKIDQSTAISRYLAKQCGLAGKNDWESLEIDSTVDTIHDVRASIASFHYESNETAKNEKLKASKELVPYYLERLDAQVKKNGGYFVGGSLTWADLVFVGLLDYLNFMMKEDIVEKYENLKQLQKTVEEVPAIKNWIEKRPPAIFSPN